MIGVATKAIAVDLTSGDVIISSESIIVHGFITSGTSAGSFNVELEDVDGNTIGTLTTHNDISPTYDQKWIADNGLVLKQLANTRVTVFYSQGGA